MSSVYWLVASLLGLCFLWCWLKTEARTLLVLATFSRPDLFRHVPYVYNQASQFLFDNPHEYIRRNPLRIVRSLEKIAASPDLSLRYRAMQAIVDNIRSLADYDESAAASALLTVINRSDASSATHHRALDIRPEIIDSLAESDPVQAVQIAQKGIVVEEAGESLYNQSCDLALKHLNGAFGLQPVMAAHAACNIARKTKGQTRESAIWTLLSHLSQVTRADFESGHAAAEQAVLLGALETPVHKAAISMWDWHVQQVMHDNPAALIDRMFYGFGISTAEEPNKSDLYEHGFDFLLQQPDIIRDYAEDVVKVSLCIGLRTRPNTRLHEKTVAMWTMALQQLCRQKLHVAVQAANDAMTFTAPGSQFERQAQMAYCQLRKLDDDIASQAHTVYGESTMG